MASSNSTTHSGGLLEGTDLDAWKGMLRVHRELTRQLEERLETEHDLSLAAYEVMMVLGDAGPRGLRMSALASELLVSRSGLTRLVDRIVARGLVERERCAEDGRGFNVKLTAAGRELLAAARPTHLAQVRELFHSRLDGAKLETLAESWRAILES